MAVAARLLALALVALALVPTAAAADTPGAALGRFVRAAGQGDAPAMWTQLSTRSRARLRTLARFRRGTAVELAEGAGSFARAGFRVVVSRDLGGGVGVAAIAGERRAEGLRELAAYGVALRRERGGWRIELAPPLRVSPIGPDQGEVVGPLMQVAAGVVAAAPVVDAAIWIDGRPVDVKSGGTDARHISVFGSPAGRLRRGRHVALAFASAGRDVAATAWTFSVR